MGTREMEREDGTTFVTSLPWQWKHGSSRSRKSCSIECHFFCKNQVCVMVVTCMLNQFLLFWFDHFFHSTGVRTNNIIVTGDMNSYGQEDPVYAWKENRYYSAIDYEGTSPRPFSYLYDGMLGSLSMVYELLCLGPDVIKEFDESGLVTVKRRLDGRRNSIDQDTKRSRRV